jgi:hypothetical protein
MLGIIAGSAILIGLVIGIGYLLAQWLPRIERPVGNIEPQPQEVPVFPWKPHSPRIWINK